EEQESSPQLFSVSLPVDVHCDAINGIGTVAAGIHQTRPDIGEAAHLRWRSNDAWSVIKRQFRIMQRDIEARVKLHVLSSSTRDDHRFSVLLQDSGTESVIEDRAVVISGVAAPASPEDQRIVTHVHNPMSVLPADVVK